jgi:hypothetical protein
MTDPKLEPAFDAPHADPIPEPPIDPVPEPLRPTARRLTYWTLGTIALFVIIGSLFLIAQLLQRPRPTAAINPPAVKQTTQSSDNP